jgi:hypothetical protein
VRSQRPPEHQHFRPNGPEPHPLRHCRAGSQGPAPADRRKPAGHRPRPSPTRSDPPTRLIRPERKPRWARTRIRNRPPEHQRFRPNGPEPHPPPPLPGWVAGTDTGRPKPPSADRRAPPATAIADSRRPASSTRSGAAVGSNAQDLGASSRCSGGAAPSIAAGSVARSASTTSQLTRSPITPTPATPANRGRTGELSIVEPGAALHVTATSPGDLGAQASDDSGTPHLPRDRCAHAGVTGSMALKRQDGGCWVFGGLCGV